MAISGTGTSPTISACRSSKSSPAAIFRRPRTAATACWSTPDYLDGLSVAEAKEAITERLEADGRGQARVEYKLRDWLFARQRYWGEPFPIVYDADGRAHPLPESALPVELPDIPDYSPVLFDPDDADSEPSPPLGKATDWVHVELDLGDGLQPYTRDTNVMPQWAASSWYELRYADPHNSEEFCAKENEAYWMGPRPAEHGPEDPGGVDLYVGGVEHAVLHLLYCAVLAQGSLRPRPRQLPRAVSAGWSTRATSRRSPTPTRAAPMCPPPRSSSATGSSTGRPGR